MNDCLEIGLNLISFIFDMLAKFRWNSVGFIVDIEKVFLNVGIKKRIKICFDFCGLKIL